MTKKYRLKCFWCGRLLKKGKIFRNNEGHPLCESCGQEYINDNYFEDYEIIFDEVMDFYNGKFRKWLKNFYDHYKLCHECETWQPNDYWYDLNDKKCSICIDKESDEKKCPIWFQCGYYNADIALKGQESPCLNGSYQKCEQYEVITNDRRI